MLVLIVGITGDLGQRLAREALARGLKVRGLGRNADKLKPEISQQLESFVTSTSYGDIPALDKATAGADAVICAYSTDPILYLDGSLPLLRAAERAGIKIFIAPSWMNDFTNMQRGDFPIYDALMSFKDQAELTSPINPVYIINGTFAEWIYREPGDGPIVDTYFGDSDKYKRPWSTMDDAAVYTIEILLNGEGVREGKGGVFRFRSGEHTLREQAKVFERVTGRKVDLVRKGDLEDAERALAEAKDRNPLSVWGYLLEAAAVVSAKGLYQLKEPALDLSHVRKPTAFEEHLRKRYNL